MTSFGLIRQYLPKGKSMARLTQHDCNAIAASSTPGLVNGSVIARRRNAMRDDAHCCTSKLISNGRLITWLLTLTRRQLSLRSKAQWDQEPPANRMLRAKVCSESAAVLLNLGQKLVETLSTLLYGIKFSTLVRVAFRR